MLPIWQWRSADRQIASILDQYGLASVELHAAWILRSYIEQARIPRFSQLTSDHRRAEVQCERNRELLRLQNTQNRRAYRQQKKTFSHTKPYIHRPHAQVDTIQRTLRTGRCEAPRNLLTSLFGRVLPSLQRLGWTAAHSAEARRATRSIPISLPSRPANSSHQGHRRTAAISASRYWSATDANSCSSQSPLFGLGVTLPADSVENRTDRRTASEFHRGLLPFTRRCLPP